MSNHTTTVAIDDGYAQVKVSSRDADGAFARHVFRSSIRSGRDGLGMVGGEGSLNAYVTEEGEDFTVSDDVVGEKTQFDGFHTSPMNRVLVTHGIREAGYGGRPIDLVVGLPVADYFRNGFLDKEKIAAKKENLRRKVTSTSGSSERSMPEIANIVVGCQAVAAYVDYSLNADLSERVSMDGTVAVIDIGGRTTDIAVVVRGGTVDFTQSGTSDSGVLDVYWALQDRIREHHRIPKASFPIPHLDRAVRTGVAKIFGREEDVSDLVRQATLEVQRKIERDIDRRIGRGETLDAVVFVGGGAALFKSVHESFPHGATVEDPEFSNARGLWKYAELRRQNAPSKAA